MSKREHVIKHDNGDEIHIKQASSYKDLICWEELPVRMREWFDYLSDDEKLTPRFASHLRTWYDVHDMMRLPEGEFKDAGWEASEGESYSSGILVRFHKDDPERVLMARYYQKSGE